MMKKSMEKLEILRSLGISEKGTRAYLALLELGKSSAYGVAKKSGLKQPTAYVVLEELRERGLVLKIPHAKRHMFIARSPAEVITIASEKVAALRQILPELMTLANNSATGVHTLFYEGLNGLREALRYRLDDLNNTEFVAFYASGVDANKSLLEIFREWNEDLLQRRISSRAIAPRHPSLKEFRALDRPYMREVKVVPMEKYSANISIDANDYFVRIMMMKEMQCVIIDNPSVARTVHQIFDMLWRALPSQVS